MFNRCDPKKQTLFVDVASLLPVGGAVSFLFRTLRRA
jgi:hypothetical protein